MDGEAELVAVVTCPKQNENLVLDDYENSARVGFGVEERSCAVCVGVCAVSPSPLSPTLPQERRENSGTSGSVKHFFSCPVWMCATWMIETQTRVRREKSVTSCAGLLAGVLYLTMSHSREIWTRFTLSSARYSQLHRER